MKKLFYASLLMVFLLSACAGNATPAATVAPSTQAPATQVFVTQVPASQMPPTQAPATAEAVVTNPAGCIDSAAFVADVTVPDNTNFQQGENFHKVWRVKNTGTCTWTDQYSMVFYHGAQMGAPNTVKLSMTKPGDTLDIAVDMTAPNQDAVYRADFEILNPAGTAVEIGQDTKLWVIITVGSATATSGSGSGSGTATGSVSTPNPGGSGPGLVTSTCAFTVDQSKVNDVVTALTAYRAQNGLPPYTVNPNLVTAAQSHSEDIACNNLFVHTGSNGSTPASRVASTGYVASFVSENVYGSFPPLTGQGAVDWWKTDQTDPTHNENLVSTKYTEIGVGYAFFNNYGYYVIDFAAP